MGAICLSIPKYLSRPDWRGPKFKLLYRQNGPNPKSLPSFQQSWNCTKGFPKRKIVFQSSPVNFHDCWREGKLQELKECVERAVVQQRAPDRHGKSKGLVLVHALEHDPRQAVVHTPCSYLRNTLAIRGMCRHLFIDNIHMYIYIYIYA